MDSSVKPVVVMKPVKGSTDVIVKVSVWLAPEKLLQTGFTVCAARGFTMSFKYSSYEIIEPPFKFVIVRILFCRSVGVALDF